MIDHPILIRVYRNIAAYYTLGFKVLCNLNLQDGNQLEHVLQFKFEPTRKVSNQVYI